MPQTYLKERRERNWRRRKRMMDNGSKSVWKGNASAKITLLNFVSPFSRLENIALFL